MKKVLIRSIPFVGSLVILLLIIIFGWTWLDVYVESIVIDIQAPNDDPSSVLPVFAQFDVGQTLKVYDVTEVTKIVVPMYVKDPLLPFVMSVLWNDRIVGEWLMSDVVTLGLDKQQEVVLEFDPPIKLDEQFEIRFDGNAISHEYRNQAPRLYFENAGYIYASGNYRIAHNQKDGDISMKVFKQEKRWQQIGNTVHTRPWRGVVYGAQGLLGLMLALVLPHVLWRSLNRKGL